MTRSASRSAAVIAPLASLGFGVALTVAVFAPGYMSPDSVAQLVEARAGAYTDWHPPVMSALWSLLDAVIPGPLGMLILQVTLFFLGAYLLFRAVKLPAKAAVLLVFAVAFYPPHLSNLVVIWKDIGLGVALLLSLSLLLHAAARRSGWLACLSWGLLTYGVAVRHNAPPAALPIGLLAGALALRRWPWLGNTMPRVPPAAKALALGLLITGSCVLAGRMANRALARGRESHPVQQILLHDVLAVSIATGTPLLPRYFTNGDTSTNLLRRLYTPNEVPMFCCGSTPLRLGTTTSRQLAELRTSWRRALALAPVAYLKHRLAVLASLDGVGRPTVCLPFWTGIVPNDMGLTYHGNRIQARWARLLERVEDSVMFRGWFVTALLVLLAVLAGWHLGLPHPATVLALSGLLYELPYLFVATTCDFRMHWWSSVAAACAAVLLVFALTQRDTINSGLRGERQPAAGDASAHG